MNTAQVRVVSFLLLSLSFLFFSCDSEGLLLKAIQDDVQSITGAPEMAVFQANSEILSGGVFEFADTQVSSSQEITFTIQNVGFTNLNLTGDETIIINPATVFSLSSTTPASIIGANETVSFTIKFKPIEAILYEAVLTIESDDTDEGTFYFTLRGSGTVTSSTPAPQNLLATSGTSTDYVTLAWNPVTEATEYRIYRNTINSPPSSHIATALTSPWNDTTPPEPGVFYYYWVCADAPDGLSDYSASASGYRKMTAPLMQGADDGTSAAGITVTWAAGAGATTYELYRSLGTTRPLESASATVADIVGTSYQDTSADPAMIYYYWVRSRAASSDSTSDWSLIYDGGYRLLPPPSDFSPGNNQVGISIAFDAVPNAEEYHVYYKSIYVQDYTQGITIDDDGSQRYNGYYQPTSEGEFHVYVTADNALTGESGASTIETVSVYQDG